VPHIIPIICFNNIIGFEFYWFRDSPMWVVVSLVGFSEFVFDVGVFFCVSYGILYG